MRGTTGVPSSKSFHIIRRYESTITAQFFGHTHFDEFELFYDPKDPDRAISVAYIGPSVTPFVDLNPGYRIYYVDGDRDQSTRVSSKIYTATPWEMVEPRLINANTLYIDDYL